MAEYKFTFEERMQTGLQILIIDEVQLDANWKLQSVR